MDVNTLLAALEMYLEAKKDFLNGQDTHENLEMTKRNFSLALNQYLEQKTDGLIADRRRVSSSTAIRVADVLAASFDGTNMAVIALNNAPSPYKFQLDDAEQFRLINWLDNLKEVQDWMEAYKSWYELIRKAGIE